nr:zinc finger MYM-type protein 1 [Tanacetum cinerariifolium]
LETLGLRSCGNIFLLSQSILSFAINPSGLRDNDSSNDESGDDVNIDDINVDNMEADNINYNDDVDVDVGVNVHDHENQVGDKDEGPKRDKSIDKGPYDKNSRRFSAAFYTRILPNNERKGIAKCHLANEGFGDWQHLSNRLKEQEVSLEHVNNMAKSVEESFLGFLNIDDTIGQGLSDVTQAELNALDLDIDDVCDQDYDNGSNTKGKHRGLLAHEIRLAIVKRIKQAKYFSMILDCTPDTSHQERISLILRYVNVSSTCVSVEESFLGFLNVDDTTGQGLFDVTQAELKALDLDIDDVCGQGYDNRSNMKGKQRGRVNLVSEKLQSDDMLINVVMTEVQYLISFFKEFRVNGFSNAVDVAKKIALEMDINPLFIQKHVIRRKRQFDKAFTEEDVILSAEESFKVNYFLYIVDQTIASLTTRFEQYQEYENIFGFLFTRDKLNFYDDDRLKSCCSRLESALKNSDLYDINVNELYVELRSLNNLLSTENMKPIDVLNFLNQDDCYPNEIIANRVLLTITVTVASAERSFSKLKLIKSYLRSSMSQERLNGLALIAIENDILESVDYEDLINSFGSKNARRIVLFK